MALVVFQFSVCFCLRSQTRHSSTAGGVGGDFVEGLDHEGLRLEGRAIPPPAWVGVPRHAHLFAGGGAFLEGFHDGLRGGEVFGAAPAVEGEGELALGLAAIGLKPEGAGLPQVKGEGGRELAVDGDVVEKETAAVEVEGVEVGGDVGFGFGALLDFGVLLCHRRIEAIEGAGEAGKRDVHAEVAQAAKAGDDVEGDVIVGAAAGKPGPGAAGDAHVFQLAQEALGFEIEAIGVK